jgi:anti-sigma regulatory factor (Ser/Thr protein kinase)
MPDTVSVDIARDLTAPAAARRAVESFGASLDPSVVPDVKLLVSELISNAVKYGRDGQVQLLLTSEGPHHVHVEVVDQGVGFVPAARDRPKTEPGGWGLHMVEALTERWGVREGSTHVWFEIDRR